VILAISAAVRVSAGAGMVGVLLVRYARLVLGAVA
jgi:hypothetical protein